MGMMPTLSPGLRRGISSCIASGVAEGVTLPVDMVKVRLQTSAGSQGIVECLSTAIAQGGLLGCWAGLAPALLRQCCYQSLSLVLHDPVLTFFSSVFTGYALQLLAGGTAGAIAIFIFNWTEVLKTQAQLGAHREASLVAIGQRIYRAEGLKGFWAGSKPNIARTFLVMAAELGTFNQAKRVLLTRYSEGMGTNLMASTIAAIASACISTPADVVKTRLMAQAGRADGRKGHPAARPVGVVQTARSLVASEAGYGALYKGFLPICVRKILWCACFFMLYEALLVRL